MFKQEQNSAHQDFQEKENQWTLHVSMTCEKILSTRFFLVVQSSKIKNIVVNDVPPLGKHVTNQIKEKHWNSCDKILHTSWLQLLPFFLAPILLCAKENIILWHEKRKHMYQLFKTHHSSKEGAYWLPLGLIRECWVCILLLAAFCVFPSAFYLYQPSSIWCLWI